MKFYLLTPIFFLGALSLPFLASTQENTENQHLITSETNSSTTSLPSEHEIDHELQNIPHYEEMPGAWPIHTEHESDTFQAKFFNMLFILGLLIGFMILASWALKRMMKAKMTNINTASTIKVLETRYLSPRATLYLIEAHDKTFLIAESPTSITHLTSFPLEKEDEEHSSPPPFPPI